MFEESVKINPLFSKLDQMELSDDMKWEEANDPPDYVRLIGNLAKELKFLAPDIEFLLDDNDFALIAKGEELGEVPDPIDPSNSMLIYIMGTTFEVKIDAIGLHTSVDPGNMILNETGMVTSDKVLLNVLAIPHFLEIILGDELTAREAKTKIFSRYLARLVVKEAVIMMGALETDPNNEI